MRRSSASVVVRLEKFGTAVGLEATLRNAISLAFKPPYEVAERKMDDSYITLSAVLSYKYVIRNGHIAI